MENFDNVKVGDQFKVITDSIEGLHNWAVGDKVELLEIHGEYRWIADFKCLEHGRIHAIQALEPSDVEPLND